MFELFGEKTEKLRKWMVGHATWVLDRDHVRLGPAAKQTGPSFKQPGPIILTTMLRQMLRRDPPIYLDPAMRYHSLLYFQHDIMYWLRAKFEFNRAGFRARNLSDYPSFFLLLAVLSFCRELFLGYGLQDFLLACETNWNNIIRHPLRLWY